ncbi:Bug family tripartite tricarboxylate transporter substrate binding protein [Roseomonas sp. BN140053]|uniref:Bug family tripartite tricarboxylate transporter substrate binding protein n=1 Tax=Roseomonas sp. BN140053 TaxID=3391898 RepID=UPI0039E96930
MEVASEERSSHRVVKRRTVLMGGAAAAFARVVTVRAEERFPSRPIRILIPFAPGGITDTMARLLAERLSARLANAPVVAENKAGATGIIAMREVAAAPPDGHTLMVAGLSSVVLVPAVNPGAKLAPLTDFTPLALAADYPIVMVVNRKLPVHSVEEFVAYAKSKPGGVSYGSVGVGSIHQLVSELFSQQTGIQMIHVPSRGGPASLMSLLAGDLDVMFEVLPVTMPYIESGEFRALAVLSPERVPRLPAVPTMVEQRLGDVVLSSWIGVYGPAGIPPALRDRLSNLLVAIVQEPETAARLRQIGFEPRPLNTAAFTDFHREQAERWGSFLAERGIRME